MSKDTKSDSSKDTKFDSSKDTKSHWTHHDLYGPGISCNRIVTRSQTAFHRIKNTSSDLDLFSDKSRHEIPGKPHMMETMKGTHGGVPRTIITRSTGKFMKVDDDLVKKLEEHKKHKPTKEEPKKE